MTTFWPWNLHFSDFGTIFKPDFLETGTFLEKTDTCVEFVLKSSLKWAKVVFFKKSDRMDLIYASVEVQILDVWSELNFFQNFAKNPWNRAYFVQKKITNKFPLTVWVHLVPRFFPEFLKNLTRAELTLSEYENIPGTPTQYNFWPILFQIFHWSFL